MGARSAILFCVAFAFIALVGSLAEQPTSKLFKPFSGDPTSDGSRSRGRSLPPSMKGPGALFRSEEERSSPSGSPILTWVPPTVAVCLGMAIGAVAVAVGLRYRRAFRMETLQSAAIEFIAGETERCVPDVKLTRSPDGRVSTALFTFYNPAILNKMADGEMADDNAWPTTMHLKDEEGTISTRDVNARFINGRPCQIVARVMLTGFESWDRFMRWMDRYAQANGLAFTPATSMAYTPKSSTAAFSVASSFSSLADFSFDRTTETGRVVYA
jgi:photosystem II protein